MRRSRRARNEFVQRSRFAAALPTSLTPTQFVNQLFANAGVTPSTSDRNAAIAEFGSATNTKTWRRDRARYATWRRTRRCISMNSIAHSS
ncbi:MAG: hypothetical protein DMF74_02220 [Acidobacteria bacterium]|nr:MAG: hypothetical protein DMF74_02220 [Acidobacteriota bacterium]